MTRFFDYEKVAAAANIAPADLDALRRHVQNEYPSDQMMCELRLLRTCSAIRDGRCTVADALKPEGVPGIASPAAGTR